MAETPETTSKALIAMRELGCKSWKERSLQLKKLMPEIQAYFEKYGFRETRKHFRLGASSMRKLGLSKVRKLKTEVIDNTAVTLEELVRMLPLDTDIGFLLAKGLLGKIESLEKELAASRSQISELEKKLKTTEEEKKKIMESSNEALAKARLGKISLADLQHAMGRGPDGTRQSFEP